MKSNLKRRCHQKKGEPERHAKKPAQSQRDEKKYSFEKNSPFQGRDRKTPHEGKKRNLGPNKHGNRPGLKDGMTARRKRHDCGGKLRFKGTSTGSAEEELGGGTEWKKGSDPGLSDLPYHTKKERGRSKDAKTRWADQHSGETRFLQKSAGGGPQRGGWRTAPTKKK